MAIGSYRHVVRVQHPAGAPVPNGDGSFTDPWVDATPPTWPCAIDDPTGSQERATAGSTIATATYQVRGHYRADVSVRSRLIVKDTRVFAVVGVSDPGLRGIELVLTCVAVDETGVPAPPPPTPEGAFYQEGFLQQQQGWAQTYDEES
jgi:head-tail adaptor